MRKYTRITFCAILFLAVCQTVAVAAAEDADKGKAVKLERIVVSPDKLREPISESASSVTVVDQEEIATRKKEFVKDILADQNDIYVSQTGAFGGETNVRIRGALPSQTYLLIDGIKVYDPASVDGGFNFANLPVDNIEQIEITRGPQTSLYGSGAIGGTIAIESKKPDKPFFEAGIEAGSFYTLSEYVNIGSYNKGLHYSFAYSQFNTQGISAADAVTVPNIEETDPYVRKSCAARVDYDITDDLTVGTTLRSIYAHNEYDSSDMTTGALVDNDQIMGKSELFLYSLYVEHQPLAYYDYVIRYSHLNNFRRDYDYPVGMSDWFEGTANRFDFQNNFHVGDFDTVSVGYDYVHELSDGYYADSAWGTFDQPKVFATNSALYLQNKTHYHDLMGTTQSMRIDNHSQFGTNTTYKIDGFFLTPTQTRLRGSYATSFKVPSLYQMYAFVNSGIGLVSGNAMLKPEKARSFELGLDQTFLNDHLTVGITYFQTRFRDLIQYDMALGTYQNSAKAKSLGVELAVEANFLEDRVKVKVGYTQLDTKDYSTDNEILRDPKNQANVTIRLKPMPKFDITTNVNYVGPSLNLGTDKMKGYTVVDWVAEYQLMRNISVYSKIDNLFNKHYQEVRGYGMPGIGAYGGIKVKY